MRSSNILISDLKLITVAVPLQGMLMHSDGIEPRMQVRHIIEIHTNEGVIGYGEVGPRVSAAQILDAGKKIKGLSPFHMERIKLAVMSEKFYRMDLAILAAGIQMACLDIQGRHAGLPVCDILGGKLRDEIPMIAYIYRKQGYDRYPSVITNEEVLEHTRDLVNKFGFRTIKFKAGAASPEEDIEMMKMFRQAFPNHFLRIDPNACWSVETSIRVGNRLLECDLEWMEDPALGLEGMAEFNRRVPIPTATNMCCIQPREFPSAIQSKAINIMLLDLWYLGGPWSARQMGIMCRTFGIGYGIHSGGGSCEMGIGIAAELHLSASLPGLVHAIDAMYHQSTDDIIIGGPLKYENGCIKVPEGPGLGVELDPEKIGVYSDAYQELVTLSTPSKQVHTHPQYPQF